MSIDIKLFDLKNDDPNRIFDVFECVYGNAHSIKSRWDWEFLKHPNSNRIRIILAVSANEIVGLTIRMPIEIVVAKNIQFAEFSTNTMVKKDWRRKGIVKILYEYAFECGLLQLSKGAMPAMSRQLDRLGYQTVESGCSRVFIVNLIKWLVTKIFRKRAIETISFQPLPKNISHQRVEKFNQLPDIIGSSTIYSRRSSEWLKWRYEDIPNRTYSCYSRVEKNTVISWFVLRISGTTAYLVDFEFHNNEKNLIQIVKDSKRIARHYGAYKVNSWSSMKNINRIMLRYGGVQLKDGPVLKYYSKDPNWHTVDWNCSHFVHSDGDFEYL